MSGGDGGVADRDGGREDEGDGGLCREEDLRPIFFFHRAGCRGWGLEEAFVSKLTDGMEVSLA